MAIFRGQGPDIYYERHGEGRPLIIFNGIMMQTESWHGLLPMLTQNRQVILVDFPDQGRSGDGHAAGYTLESVAVQMLEWIQAMDLTDYDIVGISYGGEVALHLVPLLKAIQRMPKRLILANTAAYTGNRLKAIGDSWKRIARIYDPELFFDACMPDIYSDAFYEAHSDWLMQRKEALKTQLTVAWFERFIRLVKSAEQHDARPKLSEIDIPTMVISASGDTLTPKDYQEAIVAALPKSHLMMLEGCGHASMYEAQSTFCAVVEDFLGQS